MGYVSGMSGALPAVLINGVRHLTTKTAASVLSRTPRWLRYRLDMPDPPPFRVIGRLVYLPEQPFLDWVQNGDLRNPRIERREGFRG